MKRIIALILTAAVFAACLATLGCKKNEDNLVIWTFTDELGKMTENYYKKNVDSSAKIEVHNIGVNDLATKLDNALKAKKNLPDIVAIEEKYIRKYAESGAFVSLESLKASASQMYDYTLNAAKNKDGEVMAYAWQATPGALYYRTDMAKEILNVDTPEQMQALVDTWAHFLETAKKLKDAKTANFSDVRILSDVAAPARAFYSQRKNSWITDGKLSIEPELYDGADSLYEIIKSFQVGNGAWGDDAIPEDPFVNETTERTTAWYNDMSGNKVFSYLLPSYSLQYDLKKYAANATSGTTTAGKWAVVKGPAVYSDGGTWLGIISSSTKKEKAQELIEYFTMNVDFLRAWANDTGDFLNNKSLMNEFAADSSKNESFLGGQNQYKLFVQIAESIKGNNLTPYDSRINSMFSEWAINYAKAENVEITDAKKLALDGFIDGVAGSYGSKIDTEGVNPLS